MSFRISKVTRLARKTVYGAVKLSLWCSTRPSAARGNDLMPITSELLQVFLRWMIKSVHSCIARYDHGVNKFYDKPITDRRNCSWDMLYSSRVS